MFINDFLFENIKRHIDITGYDLLDNIIMQLFT